VLNVNWLHIELVHLIWLAAALSAVLFWLEMRGQDALGRLLSSVMQHRLTNQGTRARRIARVLLLFLSMALGVGALMRPQSPGGLESVHSTRATADIVIALDVSRSMLAEDAAPTRLARAKAEVGSMVERLKGHRIGLVAFAGRATVLAPLTPDYGFFRMILRGTNTKSVSKGGTRIGDALRKAISAFDPGVGSKLILLITDGEDHDSFPEDAAKEAVEAGIRIVTVGFGSETGSSITLVDPDTGGRTQLVDKDGTVVQTRLDGALLRSIATKTEGAYIPAGVAALDLESIVDEHIEPMVQAAARIQLRTLPNEHYPWFVLASLLFLSLATWTLGPKRRSP
jgi:Ca-activated chloride channel family protein